MFSGFTVSTGDHIGVLIDYEDPDPSTRFNLSPGAMLAVNWRKKYRSGAAHPSMKLIYFFPRPVVLDGYITHRRRWNGVTFHRDRSTRIELSFENVCSHNSALLRAASDQTCDPTAPFLNPGGSPSVVWKSVTTGQFFEKVDGTTAAREWLSGLCLTHAKSTMALVELVMGGKHKVPKLICKSQQNMSHPTFMVWIPSPKPVNLQRWMDMLYEKGVPEDLSLTLRTYLPHKAGFYTASFDIRRQGTCMHLKNRSRSPLPLTVGQLPQDSEVIHALSKFPSHGTNENICPLPRFGISTKLPIIIYPCLSDSLNSWRVKTTDEDIDLLVLPYDPNIIAIDSDTVRSSSGKGKKIEVQWLSQANLNRDRRVDAEMENVSKENASAMFELGTICRGSLRR